MKNLKKADITAMLLCLLSVIPGAVVYARLPERIITNWNLQGEANGTQPKAFVVFGIPMISALILGVCCIYVNRLEAKKGAGKLAALFRILLPAVFILSQCMILLSALGKLKDMRFVTCLMVAVIMIVGGNYMPKIRKNWVFGIRTPHIVKDEEIWYKTHRFAAVTCIAGGFLSLITTFCGFFVITFVIMMAAFLVPMIYGEAIYYNRKKK